MSRFGDLIAGTPAPAPAAPAAPEPAAAPPAPVEPVAEVEQAPEPVEVKAPAPYKSARKTLRRGSSK